MERMSTDSAIIGDTTQDHNPDPAEWVELPSDDTIPTAYIISP